MKKIDDNASIIPVMFFIITIIVVGALFSMFFIEIGFPLVDNQIPIADSPYKTFITYVIRAIPLFVVVVGSISLFIVGLKRGWITGGIN